MVRMCRQEQEAQRLAAEQQEAAREAEKARKRAMLPPEPPAGSPGAAQIRIRLREGTHQRNFPDEIPLQVVACLARMLVTNWLALLYWHQAQSVKRKSEPKEANQDVQSCPLTCHRSELVGRKHLLYVPSRLISPVSSSLFPLCTAVESVPGSCDINHILPCALSAGPTCATQLR